VTAGGAPDAGFATLGPLEIAGLSGLEVLQRMRDGLLPAPPISRGTRMRLVEVEADRVVFEGEPGAEFLNPLGTVHGGWTATLLDSAMACAVHATLKPGEGYTTLEFKLNFVRAVTPATGPVRAEGVVVHRARRVATSEGRLLDSQGRLLAHGTETCLIFEAAPA
jgi:uncharacterized protein (TIGR00369 family)